MKTFAEFQEEMNKKVPPVMSLGGGGGGTDSITDTAPGRSLKKRVGDVGKILTRPFRKVKKDPTEKFATEGVAALAIKSGSKLVPALMTGIGAAGTIMQIKKRVPKDKSKTADIAREKGLDLTDPRQRMKASSLAKKTKKTNKTNKKINPKTGDFVKPRYDTKLKGIRVDAKKGEAEATEKLIDKINNPTYLEKIRRNIRKEEAMAAPTNNVGGGQIAGTVEAGDNPPVKKKKRYIYGGTGSRKMWMNNK